MNFTDSKEFVFFKNRIYVGPSISIGMCLPHVCSVDHLESMLNQMIRARSINNVTIIIPKNSCQFEERASKLKTLDLIAM